jgi:hypothetical protein
MPQRTISFLVVLVLMFYTKAFSQISNSETSIQKALKGYAGFNKQSVVFTQNECGIQLPQEFRSFKKLDIKNQFKLGFIKTYHLATTYQKAKPSLTYSILSPSFYATQLGFFCKKELQLEKLTTIPIRFRLGSLEYVNWMERKPNVVKPR